MSVKAVKKKEKIQKRPDTVSERCIWPFSSPKPHQEWSQWKGGCQEAIFKEGKHGKKEKRQFLLVCISTRTTASFCSHKNMIAYNSIMLTAALYFLVENNNRISKTAVTCCLSISRASLVSTIRC